MNENYKKYLKSRHWRKKRKEALEFYFYICMFCGGKATQVHHMNYDSIGYESMSDLIAVCKKCHNMIHGEI